VPDASPRLAALAGALLSAACASGPEPIALEDLSEEQLAAEARTELAAGRFERACDAAETLLERSKDPLLKQEGLFLAAEAHFGLEEWVKAFRHYQTLLRDYPYSKFVARCEDRVYAIGLEYVSREPWAVFGDLFSGRERGAEVMREFASSFPSSSKADDALAALAAYRFSRKEYEEAAGFYAQLVKNHPDSEWADLAAYRRAECWKLASRGAGYDTTALQRAARNYRRYLSERPDGERRARAEAEMREVDELLAESELRKARFYLAREQEPGARLHLANVALAFPGTRAAETARRELESRAWDLSVNSVDTLTLPPSAERDE
jgi:outer membrane protein assembly factor BamD (BamD/ComL family)